MSFLLNSEDLQDQKITGLILKNTINNEAPLTFKKSSKILDYKDINRSKKKKSTVCLSNFSLNSTVRSTLKTLTSISIKDNSNTKLNKFLKDLSLTNSSKKVNSNNNNIHRLTKPKTDDMKFLYKIFFNYEAESTIKIPSLTVIREKRNKNNEKYNLKFLRNYIIKIQTEFNEGGDLLIAKTDKNIPFLIDYYILKKLEDLIFRYSLIIFLFIKENNIIEAKKIFLLMLKENMRYFNYAENKIIHSFIIRDKDKNSIQSKDKYRMIYQLIKIYSFIIRYSQLFNTMNYMNKFIGKYLRLMNLNYHYFLNLANFQGLNSEIISQIIYWFSFYLSYLSYFSILNYSKFSIPIILNNIILSSYKNSDENSMSYKEKKLFLRSKYNHGILLYINNQKDEALFHLKQAEQKIKILENNQKFIKKEYPSLNRNGMISNNGNLKIIPYFDIKEKKKKLSYKSNIPIQLWKKTKLEQNGFYTGKNTNLMKSMKTVKSAYSSYLYSDLECLCKNFIKSKINISDITLLIEYGVEKGKLNNKDKSELDKAMLSLYQKSSLTNNTLRNSQLINSKIKNQDFLFPKFLIEPLLLKIELLIAEIEINKKNINEAYEHFLKSFFLFILLKLSKIYENKIQCDQIQEILNNYLKSIEQLCDERLFESNNENESIINSNGQLIIKLDNNNFEENKINKNDIIISKELEKFFIFLSSLSVYQVKVLNETQPHNPKRNDLPIFFSTQFKDCLSNLQRIQLDKLQTMVLSRFIILKNPNRWIIPSNLNTSLFNSIPKNNTLPNKRSLNHLTNSTRLKIFSLKNNKREYNNYKKILLSKKVNKEMKEFLNKNIELALKILENSSDDEIKYMINYPLLLYRPIKKYIKKNEKNLNMNMKKISDIIIFLDQINNGNETLSKIDFRKTTKASSRHRLGLNSRFSNADYSGKKKIPIDKKIIPNKNKRRNKSTGNICIKQNLIDNMNQCSFINDLKGTKDYNDSYEDYKLSIDCSFYDD